MLHGNAGRGKRNGRTLQRVHQGVGDAPLGRCYTLRWRNTRIHDISLLIVIGCAMSAGHVTQARV